MSVFKDDIGTKLKFDIVVSIVGITLAKIKYEKPDGTAGFWTAITEADTYIYYITKSGDLDVGGKWTFQPYVEYAAWKGHGNRVFLQIESHL